MVVGSSKRKSLPKSTKVVPSRQNARMINAENARLAALNPSKYLLATENDAEIPTGTVQMKGNASELPKKITGHKWLTKSGDMRVRIFIVFIFSWFHGYCYKCNNLHGHRLPATYASQQFGTVQNWSIGNIIKQSDFRKLFTTTAKIVLVCGHT